MTLEKHITDTMKEWQLKMDSFDSDIRLYYPKSSLCRYLKVSTDIEHDMLSRKIEQYFLENAKYLGNVNVSAAKDRFCIQVGKEGCNYVEQNVPNPELLPGFLEVIKEQKMQGILDFCEEYAKKHGTNVCVQKENESETVVFFENEDVEPYVYCIDQNEFGITYHRFTREEYQEL